MMNKCNWIYRVDICPNRAVFYSKNPSIYQLCRPCFRQWLKVFELPEEITSLKRFIKEYKKGKHSKKYLNDLDFEVMRYTLGL